jgi:hypothetical protein
METRMSTTAQPDTNFPSIVPELIAPEEAAKKRLAIISKCQQLALAANTIKVTSAIDYRGAGEMLLKLKGMRKELDELCRPEIQKRYEAHREATREFNSADSPLAIAVRTVESRMLSWQQEQEAARRREQERIEAEERRKAEEEARRVATEAQLAHAIEAEQSGDKELAEQILAEPTPQLPVYVPPVCVASEVPQVEGLSKRQTWSFQIEDINKIPREYLLPDNKKIGAVVRALKSHTNIPGIKVFPVDGLAGRG